MGLIKNFCDYNNVKHQIDPTGHTHSTSESWLSTIVNNLTTLINGKAASNHTHSTSESWLSTIVNNLTTLINGKAAKNRIEGTSNDDIYIECGSSSIEFGIDGDSVVINEDKITNFQKAVADPDTEPTINSDYLITSGAVATALAGKAASVHTHTISDVTGLQTELNGKLKFATFSATTSSKCSLANILTSDGDVCLLKLVNSSTGTPKISELINENLDILISDSKFNSIGDSKMLLIQRYTSTYFKVYGIDEYKLVTSWGSTYSDAKYPSEKLVKDTLDKKADLAIKETFESVTASNKIDIADLNHGNLYRAKCNIADGVALNNIFAHSGSLLYFNNHIVDTTSVMDLLFRYYKIETGVVGSYMHIIDVVWYSVPSGPL